MNKRDWKLLYSSYSGMQKKAVDLVSAEVSKIICRDKGVYTLHVLACEKFSIGYDSNTNLIAVGLYEENPLAQRVADKSEIPENGYLIKVLDNPDAPNYKLAVITAKDERNLFYGAVDFTDDYLPSAAPHAGSNALRNPYDTFNEPLPDCRIASAPKAKTRSIFTWGHPINDFQKFIENAARLKFNQLIIWNDFLPLNAEDIVSYAHEYGLELMWGFPWGWSTDCGGTNLRALDTLKEHIVSEFKKSCKGAGDGIYFQSFTELNQERIDGVLIAEAVTGFVNDVSSALYAIDPDLRIQFGLHSLSVREHIAFMEAVDPRIEIIWEDCGCFPYHYFPSTAAPEAMKETLEFTSRIVRLRNHGRTGLVYKGMMTMDWRKFVHQAGPYVMGRAARELIDNDLSMLTPMWRYFQTEWQQKGKYVWEFTRHIYDLTGGNVNLCLAGALDGGLWYPLALCAQLMWDSGEDYETIVRRVSNRPCVTMV